MVRIAMVVFSYYPADPRPRREAEALARESMSVDLICLKERDELRQEVINGVNVFRLPLQRKRSTKFSYVLEYGIFILLAFWKISLLHLRKRYNVVHVHNMPDILVVTSLIPRLMGGKVILDLHDPMPEVYMTKYGMGYSHPIIQLLALLERFSIKLAHIVLTPNISFRDTFVYRGCPEEKIHIVMNSPQEEIFYRNNSKTRYNDPHEGNKFVLMFHGTIVERHGLDTALSAIMILRKKVPNLIFHVYGDGDFVNRFLELVRQWQLDDMVKYHGRVALELIADAITGIDLGIIPNHKSIFTEINLPTRIFEYLCMGKPVVVPKTKGIKDYFNENSIFFFEPGSPSSLAKAVLEVYSNGTDTKEVLKKGMEVYRTYRWGSQRRAFLKLVHGLLDLNAY